MSEPKEKKAYALDMFREVLPALDKRNLGFYPSLTDEQAKAFSPLVVMRWMSAVDGRDAAYHIQMVNEFVNIGFWDLSKHPELQAKQLAICGSGKGQRHTWIPGTKKRTTNKLDRLILEHYPSLSDHELAIYKSKLTRDSLKQWMRDLGWPDDEIKPILEDFKKLTEK